MTQGTYETLKVSPNVASRASTSPTQVKPLFNAHPSDRDAEEKAPKPYGYTVCVVFCQTF
jgi:hypothetical protein